MLPSKISNIYKFSKTPGKSKSSPNDCSGFAREGPLLLDRGGAACDNLVMCTRSPLSPLWVGAALAAGLLCSATLAAADKPEDAGRTLFRTQVRQLLTAKCLSCHGDKTRGGLDLRRRASPGRRRQRPRPRPRQRRPQPSLPESGRPRDAAEEPPLGRAGRRLQEVDRRRGAFYEDEPLRPLDGGVVRRAGRDWWSLQPLRHVRRPASPTRSQDTTALMPSSSPGSPPLVCSPRPRPTAADCSRATFDLTGLPPTPAEVDTFLADRSPAAYERLVERLLASPAYGERWARHWLDVVRFAESHGYETNAMRLSAWPYRDYVIRTFNRTRPSAVPARTTGRRHPGRTPTY